MVTLEKIDQVVERTGISFEAAKDALNACEGDVIDAIIYIEKSTGFDNGKGIKTSDILDTLKEYIRKGNVSKIIVESDGEIILNLPVTVGAIGIILAPVVAVLGVGAAAVKKIKVKIQDSEGKIIDLNKVTAETFTDIKKKSGEIKDEIKEKIKQKDDASDGSFNSEDCKCGDDCNCKENDSKDCSCNCKEEK